MLKEERTSGILVKKDDDTGMSLHANSRFELKPNIGIIIQIPKITKLAQHVIYFRTLHRDKIENIEVIGGEITGTSVQRTTA